MNCESPIHPLWVDPERAGKAPITLSDVQFAQELFNSYNTSTTMSRKRTFEDSCDREEPPTPIPERAPVNMTFFDTVTGTLSSIASSIYNLFTTPKPAEQPAPTPIRIYAQHLGPKRRLIEHRDPSDVTPPTPLTHKFRVPGAWPATSEAPQVLTLENAQAAWAVADISERKRMLHGDSNIPYWRQNKLPPHFPYNDLDQMLEHKYLRSENPDQWDRTNFRNYRPEIASSGSVYNPKLPSIRNPIFFPIKQQSKEAQLYQSVFPGRKPQTKAYERVLDASTYRPFTGIRNSAVSTSSQKPASIEEITKKIQHYKSIRERREFDRSHAGILRYEQQLKIGIHHVKPKGYDAIKASSHTYDHGQNRPATSVLKTSDPNHRSFEPYIEGERPKKDGKSPSTPAARTAPYEGEIMDTDMMDVDGPPARGVHWPAASQITGKLHQPTKLFYAHETIDNSLPPKFRQYREHTPIEDDSQLIDETPKRYFGHEQDKEPTYTGSEPDLEEMAKQMRVKADKFRNTLLQWNSPHANPDYTPSKAYQRKVIQNHEKEMARRQEALDQLKAQIKARHERERQIREAAVAKKAEEDRQIQEALDRKAAELKDARLKEAEAYHKAISLIKPISNEWSAKIDAAMAIPNRQATVIPKHNITRHDLGTILPQRGVDSSSAWLNDQIVNPALKIMVTHALDLEKQDKTKPAKYWAADSNWLSTVAKGKGDGITRWLGKRGVNLKGKNLLEAEAILLPVCSGNHWTLVVVRPKQRIIEYLDSLSNKREDHSKIRVALMFISYELGNDFDMDDWRLVFNRSPQQDNGVDCGAFVIMNAMATIRGYAPMDWIHPNKMYDARRMIVAQLMNGGYTGEFAWMEKTLVEPDSYKEMLAEKEAEEKAKWARM